ncbi:helix-turn-helix transcriptional regulator [Streptomyces sp. HNM0574]|uniref:helix-turn-helix domain-containing protein n=1 Tax=Streptomyces sp. HNM0574 TaxID=2714954 RepID=UPI00146F3849|nr:helix-turn-helix transcriptional regulator [Streptomyces sp. HNM0574]NLU66731.1 helix-turn-helix transcriptional regulator [Streptomyces sp. HNM0574]
MSGYSSWAEVKRRRREREPEVSEAEWAERKREARQATEAFALGHHLRELREHLGLTQRHMATVLGVSQARVSQIESGEVRSLETLRAYAAALGARISVSLEYEGRVIGAA